MDYSEGPSLGPKGVITKHNLLGDFNNRNAFFRSPGDRESEIKGFTGWIL